MEALVLIFGEMVFALLAPLVVVVVDLIGAALAFVFSFFLSRRPEPRLSRGVVRKTLIILLASATVILGALFVVNKLFFAESVRMVFATLERRAGIETRCSEISGSLFSGQITLSKCTIDRTDHPDSDFHLKLDRVDFDVQLSSLFGTAKVQTAYVSGLRGSITRHQSQAAAGNETTAKPRRAFVIQDLKIEDAAVNLSGVNKDGAQFELPIHLSSATSAPLRSRLALFDILFRSNAAGDIAGAGFEIETGGDSTGRQTIWRAADVPVAKFGAVAGGALSWFHDGVVDVYVEDRWRRDGQLAIEMDWNLKFRNIEVRTPNSAGVVARLATGPIVDYVNSYDGEFPFEFQMVINESQFEYKSSLEAAGLWTAVGESIDNVLAKFGIEAGGSSSDTGKKLKETAKSVLDRFRKPNDEDE